MKKLKSAISPLTAGTAAAELLLETHVRPAGVQCPAFRNACSRPFLHPNQGSSPMCSATAQHVHVHLPRQRREHIGISRWDDLLSMNHAYPERLVSNDR